MTAERARATETPDTLLTAVEVRAILRVGPNALTRYLPTSAPSRHPSVPRLVTRYRQKSAGRP